MIEELVKTCSTRRPNGDFQKLQKAVVEKALEGELSYHLGYNKHQESSNPNYRNGYSTKTITTDNNEIEISTPRDRDASFQPQFIQKGQTKFKGFDDKIISMYARGMSMREIQEHILEIYSIDVSKEFISSVTDAVIESNARKLCMR